MAAQKLADGSVVMRTKGALSYNPSTAGTTGLSRPSTAKRLGGGGYEQSGRNTLPKGTSVVGRSALR
jgi:hypothetical protein